MNIKAETPDQIETKVKTLTALMGKHKKYTQKALRYAKKVCETQQELFKFLRNEALGEP